ncbi:uncharacterized protein [Polyergus mexicanus]|uniref:uncharacterized protein n=1 Tax=Polyergus mexicanus TaxID=615972 RepID=UPI0038B6628E
MWKMFTLNGNYKFDALSRLVREYNVRKHRTIGMRPIDVIPAIADKLLNTIYSNVKIATPARFEVVKVQKTNPVTYVLEDSRRNPVAGGFYEHELQRIVNPVHLVEKVICKKGDKVYVK